MNYVESLKAEFGGRLEFREKRPGILQLFAPLYHEDGDMLDVFLDLPKSENETVRISDHGMTLMRLSYTYDLDTQAKRRIFRSIISESGIQEEAGRLFLESTVQNLYPSLLQFAQAATRVGNMQAFKREIVRSLFYDDLGTFIAESLEAYKPVQGVTPLPGRDDLEADWSFTASARSILLFGVRDSAKARLAALSCREFQISKLNFRSIAVHEDFENLSKKDQSRITNAADKQFTSLAEFMESGMEYLDREIRVA